MQVLSRSNKEFKPCFGQSQEFAIFLAAPPAFLGSSALVADQELVHRPGNALIQQYVHDPDGISRADSDLAKRRQAISLVTDGKHARNSSSA